MQRFERYVAVGDSTSEGLDDPDGHGGYRGWANRLAEKIARQQGGLLYANLAIRGRTTRQIRDEQVAPALAMKPDLVTFTSGTNDVLRGHFDRAALAEDIEAVHRAFVSEGATVLTFTLPDLRPVMPLAHILGTRVAEMNDIIRGVCRRSGAILCDLAVHPVASDPRLWSGDRLHANSLGHARVADALAEHLGLPGSDHSWAEPLPDPAPRWSIGGELAWFRLHLAPWIWRHLRGRSSGDGRKPKRPRLEAV